MIVSYFGWLWITVSSLGLDDVMILASSFGFEEIIVSCYFYCDDWITPASFLTEVISVAYFWVSCFTKGLFKGFGAYYAPPSCNSLAAFSYSNFALNGFSFTKELLLPP